MLQAGIKYDTVVFPRVKKLLTDYPEARTTTGFFKLLEKTGPRELLEWSGKEKLNRILGVTQYFMEEGTETEDSLKMWLEKNSNVPKLKNLRGIGDKTADYFKILAGISAVAVDRHLLGFLNQAGIDIDINSYSEAREIIEKTAKRIGIEASALDHSTWRYMSKAKCE